MKSIFSFFECSDSVLLWNGSNYLYMLLLQNRNFLWHAQLKIAVNLKHSWPCFLVMSQRGDKKDTI